MPLSAGTRLGPYESLAPIGAGAMGEVYRARDTRRDGDRFIELRHEMFPDGEYPASALITVSNFARPGMLIEIQGVATIEDK